LAHRNWATTIINTGAEPLRYLSLSNRSPIEVCEYPDSGKVGIRASAPGGKGLRKMFKADAVVDYYDGESNVPPERNG
jgi:uncharacterized cupin superfamily protein